MGTVKTLQVSNVSLAVYGARNAMNSWNLSDSDLEKDILGEADMKLAQRLVKAGTEHSKFMRMIHVTADLYDFPDYWAAELDTYKVGTTRNSCSFMHKGCAEPFSIEDFCVDEDTKRKFVDLAARLSEGKEVELTPDDSLAFTWIQTIGQLNAIRDEYLTTKDEKLFLKIRALLPEGYKKRFTWDADYATLRNIYFQRRNHRLPEWHDFCDWIKTLPYAEELICIE